MNCGTNTVQASLRDAARFFGPQNRGLKPTATLIASLREAVSAARRGLIGSDPAGPQAVRDSAVLQEIAPIKHGVSLEIGQPTPVRPGRRGAISAECRVAYRGQQDAQTGLGKCARGERW